MEPNTSSTPVRRATLALALAAAILVLAVPAADAHSRHAAAVRTAHKRAAFHDAMRKLWEDHITWTRLVIIGVFEDLPDLFTSFAHIWVAGGDRE